MARTDFLLDGQPLLTREGVVGFSSVVLFEGTQRILVDVGYVGLRNALTQALQARGLTPADIDIVAATQAHWDQAQNLDVSGNTLILVYPDDRVYAAHPHENDWATPQWSVAMIEHQPTIVGVDEAYEIEPGRSIIHTPGDSPGSICVVVETADGKSTVTDDVLHYSSVALTRQNATGCRNDRRATESIDRIVAMADTIFPGNERPFRVLNGEIEYLSPFSLTRMGVTPTTPELVFDDMMFPRYLMPGIEEQSLGAAR
ncbi:MAG TPA: MBL fold metallo-hydrolase [Acidimicrobiia bacterium]|nr:MBL fold metallo-hydrolase [Acidimicrobiia bacterium]